jgi:hypothetical protein
MMMAEVVGNGSAIGFKETYIARPGLAGEYLHLFEGGDPHATGVQKMPEWRRGADQRNDSIAPPSRSNLVTVYIDCWKARGSESGLWGASMQEQTQSLWTAVVAKRDLKGLTLQAAGVRVGLRVDSGTSSWSSPPLRRVSLWMSHLAEKQSNKTISLLLDDTQSGIPAGQLGVGRATCGVYEAVENRSSVYPLATVLRELRAFLTLEAGTQYSTLSTHEAIDGVCIKYRRVTGRSLDRELVRQAFKEMGRRVLRSQARHR